MADPTLAELLENTKDGEWGEGNPSPDHEPMLVIRGTDFAKVRRGEISSLPLRYIPQRIADRKALAPGDILIETAGGTKDQPTGRTVLLTERLFQAAPYRITCASFSRFLRVKRDLVSSDYLFWFLQDLYSRGLMYPFHVQHTGVARFQYTQFASSQHVRVPSPREQQCLAAVLNALDNKIESNRGLNNTLLAMTRAVFKDWFIDFGPTNAKIGGQQAYLASDIWSRFPDRFDDRDLPVSWRDDKITALADLNLESWSARNHPAQLEYVDLANTKWGVIESTETHVWDAAPSRARRVLRRGDTIVGTVRPGNGSFAFIDEDGLTASTGFAVLRPKVEKNRTFVYCAATSKQNIDRLTHLADGAAYPAVRPDVVAATEIAVPSPAVLDAFASISQPLIAQAEANKREIRTLFALRSAALPRLMSGQIRLRDAEKLAAQAV